MSYVSWVAVVHCCYLFNSYIMFVRYIPTYRLLLTFFPFSLYFSSTGGIRSDKVAIESIVGSGINGIGSTTTATATATKISRITKAMIMATKTIKTVALVISTISLAIITTIGSGMNGVGVAAAAATATQLSQTPIAPIGFVDEPHAAALASSHSSSSSALSIKPDYGITNTVTNVTAQIGTNAYLPCKVSVRETLLN